MKRLFAVLALAASVLVGGCSFTPHNLAGCQIPRRALATADPSSIAPGRTAAEGTLAYEARFAVEARTNGARTPGDDAMLFVSGGSQNGAFGAGLLKGWQAKRPGGLPAFAVVTGVSTGSILASFAFIGDADGAVRGYTVEREGELLNPYIKPAANGIGPSAAVALARRGSIADLQPLRVRLAEAYTPELLTAVAKGQAEGRKLFVGAVDVDTGEAVAFDLTLLADRWLQAAPAERNLIKACYIEAVIASSSSPIAAPPVFIDSRMYVDGGERFGMFSGEVGKAIADRESSSGPMPGPRPVTYVIINGDQKLKQLCPWESCPAAAAPLPILSTEPHRKWNFPELALRSQKILVNQIYRFSESSIWQQSLLQDKTFRAFKIEEDLAGFRIALSDVDGTERTCDQWTEWDAVKSNPMQFFPHYMRCLIAYGEARAKDTHWDPL